MTNMDRRAFLRRGALFVPAMAFAIEEAKSGLLTGWVRRLFPGFGPGTLRAPLYPPSEGGFVGLDRILREVYQPMLEADLFTDSALAELFAPDPGPVAPTGGRYIDLRYDFRLGTVVPLQAVD